MTRKKAEDDIHGLVEISTKVNFITTRGMARVRWFGLMEAATRVTGKMGSSME